MTSKHILIVDDDPDLLFLVAHGVKNLGPDYHVSTASNPETALEQVQTQHFDVVVTDYMMPAMTGLDLIKELRQLSPRTKLIMMTAHHDTGQMRHSIEDLNLAGFVGKPFTMPELVKVIKRTLAEIEQAPAPKRPPTSLPKALIQEHLQTLRQQTAAHTILLVDSHGSAVYATGDIDQARIARLAAFVSTNFLAINELAALFGDNDSIFKSSYYEGNKYNIYAFNIKGDYFLAVVFGVGGKPGTIWFYTKQAATELAALLPASSAVPLSSDATTALAREFDDLFGNEDDNAT